MIASWHHVLCEFDSISQFWLQLDGQVKDFYHKMWAIKNFEWKNESSLLEISENKPLAQP